MQPVPIGVPGELHVGGISLARGYLNRPEMTEAKFVPNPFEHGDRLYKTGDLVKYRPDGNIVFLGRIDHQVKVRGFRIELGEIENTLANHPQVREAVLAAREDQPGQQRLVAYLVSETETPPTLGELRSYLRQSLPEYMLPSAFLFLDAFPLSPSGKVDRKALPAPEGLRPELEAEFVAPRNETETQLAEIGAQLLGLDRIGVFDNFFSLGGHSLLATQFISRVRESFQVELPLRALFEHPTIADLAVDLENAKKIGEKPQTPAIVPLDRKVYRMKRSEITENDGDDVSSKIVPEKEQLIRQGN
jgi:acyl carrier protein